MELFAAAGIDLPSTGRSAPRVQRSAVPTLRRPLFQHKVVDGLIGRTAFPFDDAAMALAASYARKVKKLTKVKETSFRPIFVDEVMVRLLGYSRVDPDEPYTLVYEERLGAGSVDTALGRFRHGGEQTIVAPFELKGPDTTDLDRIMPGRGKSPVQQAWDYANDAPGAKWVLVSNCVEIRLYGYGRGRAAYESFDLRRLDEPEELRRLWALLSAKQFLGGAVDELLGETDRASKDITDQLYVDYSALRDRLLDFLVNAADGPKLNVGAAIEPAQKILDRVLFIAFGQRNDLMNAALLDRAVTAQNEFSPVPVWRNFVGLFRKVDRGDFDMDIPPYNGGLFAGDALVDGLNPPDALVRDIAALGQWDYRREVPVEVLGHIFERSITDIDKLRAQARGEKPPDEKKGKKKKEGVVYTRSEAVIRFIVEQTLGHTLGERRSALRARMGLGEEVPADREVEYLRAWIEELRRIAIIDPACGSGAFLVAAFDRLAVEYRPVVARLEELGEAVDFDIFDEIVTANLHGVDINTESVEITRLSLWLKTARRGRKLQNLEGNIKAGDSVVADGRWTARPFDWGAAFPKVFARGGFDVVVGNPPYVRMEHLKPIKPYLAEHYVVAADRADLYAYFFERGVRLLKEGGRLGYISSSTFFRTGSGENLRVFLADGAAVEGVIDFGDLQLFEGVTTYPAILILRKGAAAEDTLRYLVLDAMPDDLIRAFREASLPMRRARLGSGSWRLEPEEVSLLRDKIAAGRKTLGEVYGAPLYGIKTGLNEAFVIDTPTQEAMVARDPRSAEILQPFLHGEEIKRWRVEGDGWWLINTPKGKVDIARYPEVEKHLLPHREALEKRATKQEWWELQQAQLAYQSNFAAPKLVYQDITAENPFSLDNSGNYLANTCYFIPSDELKLLAYLNSTLAWFNLAALTNIARGGYLRLRTEFVEQLPIPDMPPEAGARLTALAESCTDDAKARHGVLRDMRARIQELAPGRKLTERLLDWPTLDFAGLLAEASRALKADIPLKKRAEWEDYFTKARAAHRRHDAAIAAAEREIDAIVYALFDLTAEEIALLETSIGGPDEDHIG